MNFLGNIIGYTLPSILKLFLSKKVNGVLELKDKDFKAFLWFQNGNLIHAISTKTLIIKEALKRLNLLNENKEKELGDINDFQIDKLLIEKAYVSDKIITYLRSYQIANTLYKALGSEKLTVNFRENIKLEVSRLDLLPSYNWFAEISQNAYHWLELKTKIPKSTTRLRKKKINFTLSKEEEKIYNLCDEKKDITDIALWSSTNYFKANTLISSLLSKDALDYEQDISHLSTELLKEIAKTLSGVDQLPGVKSSFIVNKEGKMIAKNNKANDNSEMSTEMMASIFSNTVSNFENNLKNDDDNNSEMIEQLLVERENGEKTLLYISGKVILVSEALSECDWGLLRLSAKRAMNSIKQLISVGT